MKRLLPDNKLPQQAFDELETFDGEITGYLIKRLQEVREELMAATRNRNGIDYAVALTRVAQLGTSIKAFGTSCLTGMLERHPEIEGHLQAVAIKEGDAYREYHLAKRDECFSTSTAAIVTGEEESLETPANELLN